MTEENKTSVRPIMMIDGITIRKDNFNTKVFECSISLKGGRTYPADINLKLDAEKTEKIIDHVADLILEATGIMISDLRDDARRLVEKKRAKELPAPVEGAPVPPPIFMEHGDDIPL